MFEIDLDVKNEGTWFLYQESHFDQKKGEFVFDPPMVDENGNGPRVRVRRMGEFFSQINLKRETVREIVLNEKTGKMEPVSYLKDLSPEEAQRESDDGVDYMITGIENFKNKATGEIIECTRENKIALMRVPAFDRFIARCMRIISGIEREQAEAEKKT